MKLITFMLVLLLANATAFAGEPTVWVGVSGGYIVPIHSGTFNFSNPNLDTTNVGKSRYSFDKGVGFHISANGVFILDKASRYSLGASIGYSQFSSYSEKIIDSYFSQLANGDSVLNEFFIGNEYSQSAISADFDLRYKPFDNNGLGIIGGASVTFITSSSYRYIYGLVFNPNSPGVPFELSIIKLDSLHGVNGFEPKFKDETRTEAYLYKGELPDINPLQISLRAGLFYDIAIEGIMISPSVVYHFPFTKITSSQDWKIHQLIGSLDIRIPL